MVKSRMKLSAHQEALNILFSALNSSVPNLLFWMLSVEIWFSSLFRVAFQELGDLIRAGRSTVDDVRTVVRQTSYPMGRVCENAMDALGYHTGANFVLWYVEGRYSGFHILME